MGSKTNGSTLMNDNTENRWAIANLDTAKFSVTVSDSQMKKKRTYTVPYLTHAIIKNECLLVSTSFNKIMEINLSSGSRKFVS